MISPSCNKLLARTSAALLILLLAYGAWTQQGFSPAVGSGLVTGTTHTPGAVLSEEQAAGPVRLVNSTSAGGQP